jgi:hypothetical protein
MVKTLPGCETCVQVGIARKEDNNAIGDMLDKCENSITKVQYLQNLFSPAFYFCREVHTMLSEFRFSKVKSNSVPLKPRMTGMATRFDGGITWPQETVVMHDGSR